jgi:hypothetical protein
MTTAGRSTCSLCTWQSQLWPVYDMAMCEGTWHTWECHTTEWELIFGKTLPNDPDPRVSLSPWES